MTLVSPTITSSTHKDPRSLGDTANGSSWSSAWGGCVDMCVCDAAKSLSNVLNGLIFEQTSRSQRQSDLSAQTTFSAGTRKNSVAAIHSNFSSRPVASVRFSTNQLRWILAQNRALILRLFVAIPSPSSHWHNGVATWFFNFICVALEPTTLDRDIEWSRLNHVHSKR